MEIFSQFLHSFLTLGRFLYHSWWIIFPPLSYYIFKILWIDFAGIYSPNSWHQKKDYTMVEIIPPREIERGPKMMESFFTGLTGVYSGFNNFQVYLDGAIYHDRFSLELVSEEGKIHFYIRMEKKNRNMVEAQIYAQYPDAEIIEVEDYAQRFPKIIPNKKWDLWGADFEYVLPNAFPIRTYDKFEESITGEMIDPMAALLETMGTLGPGQHCWMQIILQPLAETWKKEPAQQDIFAKLTGREAPPEKTIMDHLAEVFTNIWGALFAPVEFAKIEKKDQAPLEFRLTPQEKDTLKAVEEKFGKNCFKTKLRFMVLGRKEVFGGMKAGTIIGAIKQFNDINVNQIKPEEISKTYGKIFGVGPRAAFRKRKLYGRYRSRSMDGVQMVMSVKELATVYHFPDMSVRSPAVTRTSAKLGAAPLNLPVE
jgi:hypothetical protein